jgi:hypothetical protein
MAGFARKIKLDFHTFNSLVPYSSLIDEFQFKIFGVYIPEKLPSMLEKMQQQMPDFSRDPSPKNSPRFFKPEELEKRWIKEILS